MSPSYTYKLLKRTAYFFIPIQLNLNQYRSATVLANWYQEKYAVDALGLVFGFIKLFKYFQLSKRLRVISMTLQNSFEITPMWTFCFVSAFFGYSLVLHFMYGKSIDDFSLFSKTLRNMLCMMLGNLPFNEMMKVSPNFTPIFVGLFYFTINYVLLNMLIAVLHFYYNMAANHEKASENAITEDAAKAKGHDDGIRNVLIAMFPFLRSNEKNKNTKRE